MKRWGTWLASLLLFANLAALVAPVPASAACGSFDVACGTQSATPPGSSGANLPDAFKSVINVIILAIGAIAVLMVVIGGLMYVLSAGDPNSTRKAKDTILFAIIGVIVAILAYAIVNFVIRKF